MSSLRHRSSSGALEARGVRARRPPHRVYTLRTDPIVRPGRVQSVNPKLSHSTSFQNISASSGPEGTTGNSRSTNAGLRRVPSQGALLSSLNGVKMEWPPRLSGPPVYLKVPPHYLTFSFVAFATLVLTYADELTDPAAAAMLRAGKWTHPRGSGTPAAPAGSGRGAGLASGPRPGPTSRPRGMHPRASGPRASGRPLQSPCGGIEPLLAVLAH